MWGGGAAPGEGEVWSYLGLWSGRCWISWKVARRAKVTPWRLPGQVQDARWEHDLLRSGSMGACGSGRDLSHRDQALGTKVQLS